MEFVFKLNVSTPAHLGEVKNKTLGAVVSAERMFDIVFHHFQLNFELISQYDGKGPFKIISFDFLKDLFPEWNADKYSAVDVRTPGIEVAFSSQMNLLIIICGGPEVYVYKVNFVIHERMKENTQDSLDMLAGWQLAKWDKEWGGENNVYGYERNLLCGVNEEAQGQ